MSKRKRWASKEEAEAYVHKALQENNLGLSFWAACDYIGWTRKIITNIRNFQQALYADWLISRGIRYIKEEINNIKWELNTIRYLESRQTKASTIKDLEDDLQVAKDELDYLQKWKKHR